MYDLTSLINHKFSKQFSSHPCKISLCIYDILQLILSLFNKVPIHMPFLDLCEINAFCSCLKCLLICLLKDRYVFIIICTHSSHRTFLVFCYEKVM